MQRVDFEPTGGCAHISLPNVCNCGWIEPVLSFEHPRRERLLGVFCPYRHRGLGNDWFRIECICNEMNRCAVLGHTGRMR
jgi:hypothetical protein